MRSGWWWGIPWQGECPHKEKGRALSPAKLKGEVMRHSKTEVICKAGEVLLIVVVQLLSQRSTICDSTDYTPGSSALHYLLEFAQTHVHWVSDAFQPCHPLLPPTSPALNTSQHQGLFQWVGTSSHQAAKESPYQEPNPSASWPWTS